MTNDLLGLLCDPLTHDPLQPPSSPAGPGEDDHLLNPASGQRFPIREGIPVFLEQADVSGSNGKYQRLYDGFAPFYDFATWLYARWKGTNVETRLREYLDELEVKPTDRVLEVSVGTGRNLPFLTPGARLYGLDLSWGMLQRCARNAARRRLDVALVMGSAEHLPFRAETFDVVFHFGGINFFNDRAAALREMVRVAKPGTKFIVGDENEALARKYERVPVTGEFYGNRQAPITAPVDLLPPGMQDVQVKDIAGGDLYCLSFRKPR
jgi:ubiquinone/menaquinone biosynthesis C-methylase UbiE